MDQKQSPLIREIYHSANFDRMLIEENINKNFNIELTRSIFRISAITRGQNVAKSWAASELD